MAGKRDRMMEIRATLAIVNVKGDRGGQADDEQRAEDKDTIDRTGDSKVAGAMKNTKRMP
jgi:hypothetical protein